MIKILYPGSIEHKKHFQELDRLLNELRKTLASQGVEIVMPIKIKRLTKSAKKRGA